MPQALHPSHMPEPTVALMTERLLLRPFVTEDIAWFAELSANPLVMQFSPKGPLDRKEAQTILRSSIESFKLRGFGLMACFQRIGLNIIEPIGFCGIALREAEGVVYPELGYRLFPQFWGLGFATEAAQKIRDFAFSTLQLPMVVSFIDPKNIRSIKVAEKIGETFAFHATYRGIDIAVYRLCNEKRP